MELNIKITFKDLEGYSRAENKKFLHRMISECNGDIKNFLTKYPHQVEHFSNKETESLIKFTFEISINNE